MPLSTRPRLALNTPSLLHVMAAHSPLSAKLVEEAGFDGVWASGFELSALYGLPDVSLVSMTQHLDMVRAMAGQIAIPIVADIDTGFGNAVNVDYAVRQYEQAGAAAVVIEDKSFPKVTSLIDGGRQELVPVAEFEGKVRAALAARTDPEFRIIARTEALIAGLGQAEGLKRAHAYAAAGADLIVVHSKAKTPDEVESFVHAWDGPVPLVLIPTAYPQLSGERIERLGKVKVMIYGNHAIRAAILGRRQAFERIRADRGIQSVHADLPSVEEVFALQGMDKVKALEADFLR